MFSREIEHIQQHTKSRRPFLQGIFRWNKSKKSAVMKKQTCTSHVFIHEHGVPDLIVINIFLLETLSFRFSKFHVQTRFSFECRSEHIHDIPILLEMHLSTSRKPPIYLKKLHEQSVDTHCLLEYSCRRTQDTLCPIWTKSKQDTTKNRYMHVQHPMNLDLSIKNMMRIIRTASKHAQVSPGASSES